MNPGLGEGRGLQLDEKIAISVALALGIPLVLLLFWLRGFFPSGAPGGSFPWGSREIQSGTTALAAGASSIQPVDGQAVAALTSEESASWKTFGDGIRPAANRIAERKGEVQRGAGKGPSGMGGAGLEELNAEKERLGSEKEELEREAAALREEFAGAKALHSKLVRDSQAREQQLNEVARKLQDGLERSKSENADLKKELERLRSDVASLHKQGEDLMKLQSALAEEKKERLELQESLKISNVELTSLKARLDAATAQAKKAEGEESPEALKAARAALQAEVENLRKKLQEAEAAKTPTPAAAAALEDRMQAPEAENKRLQTQVRAGSSGKTPIRAKVIVPREAVRPLPEEVRKKGDLWQGAVPLSDFLREAAKDRLGVPERDEAARAKNMGRLVARLQFARGKSEIEPEEKTKLQSLLSEAGEQSYYLVVGYASLPGCIQQNRELSQRRAEAVSAAAKQLLKAGAQLQKMYFGETNQFDSKREEENQVVEIWRVGP